jgi:phosphoribosylformylglycinamidine synthase
MLPGAMLRNRSLTYVCRYVHLRVDSTDSPITASCRRGEILRMPVGHADGNYYAEPGALDRLEKTGAILLRYTDGGGELTEEANPNGSLAHIAAVRNDTGNVVGIMPHPDRCYEPSLGTQDGVRIFQSLVTWVSQGVTVER